MSGAAQRRAVPSLQGLVAPALFALGVAIIWAPGRPAMVDLPQHAAQVAMLRDLTLGRSAWAPDLQVNLATPYLVGYLLALPLALVLSPLSAIKVVLTAAYAAFGLIGRAIGRELGAPPALNGYYFFSFFGIAWSYGLYTFLVAAPVGLAFIWAALAYARRGGWGRGALVAAAGVATVFSHGFIYVFALAIGLGLLLIHTRRPRRFLARVWPFALSTVVCAALALLVSHNKATAAGYTGLDWVTGALAVRPFVVIAGGFDAWATPWAWVVGALLLVLPLLAGHRLARRRPEAWLIAGVLAALMLLAPFTIMQISVYPRFALFVAPAYAWLIDSAPGPRPDGFLSRWLAAVVGVLAAFALVQHLAGQVAFAREAGDFDRVLARAQPGRRALSLVIDRGSASTVNPLVYLNFPQWYAVEKGGFVDLSFAVDPQMVVRLAHPDAPPYDDSAFLVGELTGRPLDFNQWSYVFVRGQAPPRLFGGCTPTELAASGAWKLLAPRRCPPP